MRGIYKGILVEVYEHSSLKYHIEPINMKDIEKCEETNFVEYQMHWYATVSKEDVQIIE